LKRKKLSLVVDLDQTVLHATVDPHLERWIQDPNSPEALRDVKPLQLSDSPFTYYIKFRPGWKNFFDQAAHLFELHIYTMGSRSYANEIVKLIDPDRVYFSDRIISRDENSKYTYTSLGIYIIVSWRQ
jgi:RNA polymerase II subunit A-like phosphatase